MDRRRLLTLAVGLGAGLAWAGPATRVLGAAPTVDPSTYPQGVASGDPAPDSVILWTRHAQAGAGGDVRLTLEVFEDEPLTRRVAITHTLALAEADGTCRVVVGGLQPGRTWWYRFTDPAGLASRTGRTFTAPADADGSPFRLAFVSCQNVPLGWSTPYRRLIWEEGRKPVREQVQFVLHLGDFIYDEVWYPEDRPDGFLGRRLRDKVRFPDGGQVGDVRYPVSVADYRALYKAYLEDPDIQDARALWPFICVWDDHEFSNDGWQSGSPYADEGKGAQTRKVAANQAWFEFIPARVARGDGAALDRFVAPDVTDAPLGEADDHGLVQEPNNLAALDSLRIWRSLRWGANVELILTDNRSWRSRAVMDRPEAASFRSGLPWFEDQSTVEILDAGRRGPASQTLRIGDEDRPNPLRDAPPGSMLGRVQKAWLKDRLARSSARWKLWGNSLGLMYRRSDLHNLPEPLRGAWIGQGYAQYGTDDWCGYPTERAEILDWIRTSGVSNVVSLAGDRHNFFAGVVSASLPPGAWEPVAAEFCVSSISTPTSQEAADSVAPPDHPLSALFLHPRPDGGLWPGLNLSVLHGVAAALAFRATGSAEGLPHNPELAPHLAFADMGSHGFATALVETDRLTVEFVGMARPLSPPEGPEGGPALYRIAHALTAWTAGEGPALERILLEGDPPLGSLPPS